MRCTSGITEWYTNNWSNHDAVIHCAIDRMRTVFWGHNFTNGNDYRLCIAHRVCYYGLVTVRAGEHSKAVYLSNVRVGLFPPLTFNPLSPHDALKHHFTYLKTDLIFIQPKVLERIFPWNWFTITWSFSLIFQPHKIIFIHYKSRFATAIRVL